MEIYNQTESMLLCFFFTLEKYDPEIEYVNNIEGNELRRSFYWLLNRRFDNMSKLLSEIFQGRSRIYATMVFLLKNTIINLIIDVSQVGVKNTRM